MLDEIDLRSFFDRSLRETSDRTMIESRCKQCGHIMLGTAVFEDLLQQEQEHFRICGVGRKRASKEKVPHPVANAS